MSELTNWYKKFMNVDLRAFTNGYGNPMFYATRQVENRYIGSAGSTPEEAIMWLEKRIRATKDV